MLAFAVTLDYKALLLLLNKGDDEDFVLGGKGYDSEFCFICDAIRVSKHVLIVFNKCITVITKKRGYMPDKLLDIQMVNQAVNIQINYQ